MGHSLRSLCGCIQCCMCVECVLSCSHSDCNPVETSSKYVDLVSCVCSGLLKIIIQFGRAKVLVNHVKNIYERSICRLVKEVRFKCSFLT